MTRAFLDANVFVYASGRSHDLKEPSRAVLRLATEHFASFVTDSEVFQEMLHRYLALRVWSESRANFVRYLDLMRARTEPMLSVDVRLAASLAENHKGLSARDLVHLAVMRRIGCPTIVTADSGFDGIDGITRLDPMRVDEWRSLVTDAASP